MKDLKISNTCSYCQQHKENSDYMNNAGIRRKGFMK